MSTVFEQVVAYLDQAAFHYRIDPDAFRIQVDAKGEVSRNLVTLRMEPDRSLFHVYCFAPITVPEGARPSVAEAIVRANHGLGIGRFEMEVDEGELLYHICQMIDDNEFSNDALLCLIGCSVELMDRYLPAILTVIYANECPKEAIRFAESGT